MTEDGTDALEQALALYATPGRLPMLLKRPLPRAVLLLIRIAGGDSEAIASASARTAESRRVIVDAALLYIQQILFHDGADSYRLLGVRADAGNDTIKEHYRWLMHWLHPDRQPERWEVVYSERVNRAWNSLNSEQRRDDYDTRMRSLVDAEDIDSRVGRQRRMRRVPDVLVPQPVLSPRTVQRLPLLVLGGFALISMILLVAFFRTQQDQRLADIAEAGKSAVPSAPIDDSSAQKEAIRRRMVVEEHVIDELTQPTLPTSPPLREQAGTGDSSASMSDPAALPGPSTGTAATGTSVNTEAARQAPGAESAHSTVQIDVPLPADRRIVASKANSEPDGSPLRSIASNSSVPQPSTAKLVKRESGGATGLAYGNGRLDSAAIRTTTPKKVPLDVEPTSRPVEHRSAPTTGVAAAPMSSTVADSNGVYATGRASGAGSAKSQTGTRVTNAVIDASTDGMSPQHAMTLVPQAYEDAYAKGDLAQMMRLFAPDAVENHGGIENIRDDYSHLFQNASVHELRLEDLHWILRPDRIVGSGSCEARIRNNDEQSANRVRGWIQIEAVPMDGNWKIQRLLYRNAE
jgi:hypothetical protein